MRVIKFNKYNNINYGDALRSSECKELYKRCGCYEGEGLSFSRPNRNNPKVGISNGEFDNIMIVDRPKGRSILTDTQITEQNRNAVRSSRQQQYQNRYKTGKD